MFFTCFLALALAIILAVVLLALLAVDLFQTLILAVVVSGQQEYLIRLEQRWRQRACTYDRRIGRAGIAKATASGTAMSVRRQSLGLRFIKTKVFNSEAPSVPRQT
jgi:hypothetical protein